MNGPMGRLGAAGHHKVKDFRGTVAKTVRYMRKDLIVIILAFVFAIGGVVATLLVPEILGGATDKLMEGTMQKTLYQTLQQMEESYNYDTMPEEQQKLIDNLVSHNMKLGDLVNAAKDPNMPIPDDVREQILQIPSEMYNVSVKIFYGFDAYETLGDAIADLNMEKMFESVPESYRAGVYSMSLKQPPQIDVEHIVGVLVRILILVICSAAMGYVQGFLLAGVAQRLSYRMRQDLSKKFNALPLKYFDSTTHGEVMSLITNDIDTISMSLNQSLSQVITSITTIIGVLIMMLRINWLLTLISLCVLPVTMFVAMLIVRKSQKYFIAQQTYLGHVNGYIEEKFNGHNVVKLFNGEEKSVEEFSRYNNELYGSAWSSQFFSGLMHPMSRMIGNLCYVIVCVVGGAMTIGAIAVPGSDMSVGGVQAFITYVRQFNQPIMQVASVANTLQSTVAAAERVFDFLEQPEEVETGVLAPADVHGDVSFSHVRFGYTPERTIIKDFSCDVKSGQRVAIVGPTGAGKTTIVKLLMRFYDLNAGSISIDGTDITHITRQGLRNHVGMVLQDTWLFGGTIMENIRYGRLDATDEEVIAAAKTACADHFIQTLPGGYQFEISSDASNVSQGQKQLLTIARAILADPSILILDEATSSVDTRTEVLIQQAMERLMQGRTNFIIAHRLSTIRNADRILVLNDGDVVEQGKHEELLQRGGFYAKLYNAQFDNA